MLVMPSIDLQAGHCVRLQQGDFKRASIYETNALDLATQYAKQGAQCLHVVDLDGAKQGAPQQLALIETLAASGLPIQAGGGIRTVDHAKATLSAGASTVVIGSIAVTAPDLVLQILKEIRPEHIVLALDVNMNQGNPTLAIHGWQTATEQSLWDVVAFYQETGIFKILCTDIAMDGMLKGPNFSLYEEAQARFPTMHWQASGGIRNLEDIRALPKGGLSAAIIGRALYESNIETSAWFEENC
ncbi:MAG: 1-(5-phosphoribosyl)-5-[(5-phosphoribosylamino)methylideneamino]imidazole-4-carboxamide isomerase [Gammaproteobacteria bacterium]|nr:1-(5-phosphoribosyl)-5-[(5-phosphoribosylamino)methylideneamino]imidazole-4-carboxamide isomerase [Gammaproteobacteria bacterium]